MKKITINLHPAGNKADNKVLEILAKYIPFVFIGLVILIVVNILLLVVSSSLRLPQGKLEKQWSELSPKIEEVVALKKEMDTLITKRNGYRKLVKGEVVMSKVLIDIFETLPINIWIAAFSFTDTSVGISGHVLKWGEDPLVSIDKFITDLNKRDYISSKFKTIKVTKTKKEMVVDKEIVDFKIECYQ